VNLNKNTPYAGVFCGGESGIRISSPQWRHMNLKQKYFSKEKYFVAERAGFEYHLLNGGA